MTSPTTATRAFTTATKSGTGIVPEDHDQTPPELNPMGAVAVRPADAMAEQRPQTWLGSTASPEPSQVSRYMEDEQP